MLAVLAVTLLVWANQLVLYANLVNLLHFLTVCYVRIAQLGKRQAVPDLAVAVSVSKVVIQPTEVLIA